MTSALLLQAVDLSSSGPTPEQTALAVLLLATFFGALVLAGYLIQFVGLPGKQRREKKALIGQRENQDPETLRIEAGENPHSHLEDVRALFSGDPPDVDYPNLRVALGVVRDELGESWHSYASTIPRLARWLAELAVGFAITAALVHVSTGTFERLFNAGGGSMSISELIDDLLWVVGGTADVIGLFPYLDIVWALAFAYGIQALQWLYNNPLPILVLLVGGALAVVYLDRRAPQARTVSVRSDRSDIITVVASFTLLWFVGAIPAALFGAVGLSKIGGVIGLVCAVLVSIWLGFKAAINTVYRVRRTVQLLEGESREAVAYIAVRRLGLSLAAIATILTPTYALSVLVSGKLAAVIGAFLGGSFEVQLAVGLLTACVIGLVGWVVRDAIPNVRVALRALMAKSAIRVAVFGRGAPIIVMTVVYFLSIGFGLNWLLGISLSLVAGIAARAAYKAFRRVRYRVSELELPDTTPDMVLIQAYQLETTNGEVRYYADVNTVSLAHEDPDVLAREICDVAADVLADGETETSIERSFAEDLVRFGKVDLTETRKSLMTDAKAHGKGWLQDNGGMMDAEELDEKVTEHVPENIWTEWRNERLDRGDWRRRNGYYLLN